MSRLAKILLIVFAVVPVYAGEKGLFVNVPVNVPPQTQVCKGMVEPANPRVEVKGNGIIFENGHFIIEFAKLPSLSISRLYNKYTQSECIPGKSRLFLLWVDEKLLDANDFVVRDVNVGGDGSFKKAAFLLDCEKDGIEAVLSVGIDQTPEARLELELRNKSQNKRQLRVLFPYFENVLLGDVNDNYYFFPYKGGINSNKPYELASAYTAHPGSIQLISIYNPQLGGGIYTRVEDSSGRAKTFLLQKKDKNGTEEIGDCRKLGFGAFEELTFTHKEVFLQTKGSTFGCYSYPYDVEPNGTVKLPDSVLALHGGDFLYALDNYSKWLRTWFKHDIGTPQWYKDCFYYPVSHERAGNTGWEKGFIRDNKIALSQIARPYEHAIQLACWADHPKDDHLGDSRDYSWYRYANPGDFYYEEEWGGAEALKEEFRKARMIGPRITLYGATQWAVWYYSDIYKQHSDWARFDKNGREVHDYWWDLNDNKDRYRYVDFCGQVEEWQDWCAQTNRRILKDTGASGIYLDVMSQMPFCYNPKHKHEEYPAIAAEKMLKKNFAAVRSADSEAVIEIEDFCSDYLLQWVDGCWMKTFYQDLPPEVEQNFDLYSVSFVRFMIPDVKWTDFGPRWIYGSRRALFNGMAYNISEVMNKNYNAKANEIDREHRIGYLIRICELMRENGDAFSSMDCKALVPTLHQRVYANYFGAGEKKIYTLYNKNDIDVNGPIIGVEADGSYHCVELLYDEEVVCDEASGRASLSIAPWDVVCLARLPIVMQIERRDSVIDIVMKISVSGGVVKVYADDDGVKTGEEIAVRNDLVRMDAGKYQGKRLIIKLFESGHLLDEKIITIETSEKPKI